MKNKNFKINNEIDFNDIALNSISPKQIETKIKKEKFQSMMQKAIREEDLFNELIEDTNEIDFEVEANGSQIKILRALLNNTTDYRTKEITERKIQKLTPNNLQKYVIIINRLLALTEEKGLGIGVSNDEIYYYNGQYWKKTNTDILMGFLGDFAEKSGLEPLEAQQFKVKEFLLKQFHIAATIPNFNSKDTTLKIPVLNGTLTLNKGEVKLSDFKKEHFLKYQLNFRYDVEAKAPLFQKFLDKVLPEEELKKVLLEFLGYIFIKDISIEKMLLLYGSGSNGKSVLNDIIVALLGSKNITTYLITNLCKESSQTRPFIENTLLNYSQEFGSGKYDIDILKTIISNQNLEVKKLYKDPYVIENYGRLASNCNILPRITENNNAFYRRFIIIPFRIKISDEEKDINLAEKIITNELPGVFNMVIEGMKRLIKQGDFTKSKIIENELEKYKRESNSILSFLDDEGYIPTNTNKIPIAVFYDYYKDYCTKNTFHAFSSRKFNEQIRNAGYEIYRSNNGYFNISFGKKNMDYNSDSAKTINTDYNLEDFLKTCNI